jgi:Asp-tRNA(Asn)/Glu-tRNA(Gln) amidotransferase A subunit family amidase
MQLALTEQACTGPMARNFDDLQLAFQVVAEATCDFRGEQVLRLPWRDANVPQRLKVGWYVEDECIKVGYLDYVTGVMLIVQTSPACARAVKEAVDAMRLAGHQVCEFKPPDGKSLPLQIQAADFASLASSSCKLFDIQEHQLTVSGFRGTLIK